MLAAHVHVTEEENVPCLITHACCACGCQGDGSFIVYLPFWGQRLLRLCSEDISIHLSALNPKISVPYDLPKPGN